MALNNRILCLVLCIGVNFIYSQVKIGENLQLIDGASILELESTTRALILTRVTQEEMNAIVPLHGALVYNSDTQCIYMYDGAVWKNLCETRMSVTTSTTRPEFNQVGDIWINQTKSEVSIWNGTNFIPIYRGHSRGNGIPPPSISDNFLAGDIYVDKETGYLYTFDGSNWVIQGNSAHASNGLNKTKTNTFELGGVLTRPTTIGTDSTRTLAIEGLEMISSSQNMVVTIDTTTNILQKSPMTSLIKKEEILILANEGQQLFTTPISISGNEKIEVYRNGVKIGFTVVANNTIQLDPDAICFQNDEIRIVQFF